MQVIIYKFVDGTTNAVEVTEDIYLIHLELLQQEKRNHWKETRRHTSLYYFTDMGIDFEDKRIDLFAEIVRKENAERVIITIIVTDGNVNLIIFFNVNLSDNCILFIFSFFFPDFYRLLQRYWLPPLLFCQYECGKTPCPHQSTQRISFFYPLRHLCI